MRNKNIETMKFYLNVQDTCVEWCSNCDEEINLKADAIGQVCLCCGEKLLPCNLCDMDKVECYDGKCIVKNKEIVTLHGYDNKVYRFQHKDLQRLLFYVFDYDCYVEDFLEEYTYDHVEQIINNTKREGIGEPCVAEVEEILINPKDFFIRVQDLLEKNKIVRDSSRYADEIMDFTGELCEEYAQTELVLMDDEKIIELYSKGLGLAK